jgi:hypothetical protein
MRLKPYLVLSSSLFSFLLCKEDSPILEGERQSEICRVFTKVRIRHYRLQRLPLARDWKERSLMLRTDIVKCVPVLEQAPPLSRGD